MHKPLLSIILVFTVFLSANADIDSAKRQFNSGEYDKALPELEALVKKSPKDAAANYYLGATLYRMGRLQDAIAPLKAAEAGNWPVAAQTLAEINLKVLNLDAASDHIDRWAEILEKQKKDYPQDFYDIRDRVLMARNMLERVEKIQIIETMQVDSVDFFSRYMLSPSAGQLLDASFLPDEYAQARPRVVYQPENGKELVWGMPDDGKVSLVVADVLDDGSVTEPVSMGREINDGGDADFPYMLQDGVTIYYGGTGEASLGGYDIFMTRRSADDSLLQPQNIGMPYNSPYNDYMMVIDEDRNIGWWASDREHIPGKVTIYTFVPSTIRVNHNPDSENISDLALLRNIETTGDLEKRIADDESTEIVDDDSMEDIYFTLSDGRVYTKLSQFKNQKARDAMRGLLKRMFDLEVMEAELDELRLQYGRGNKSKSKDILKLENSVKEAKVSIEHLTNQIIALETKK